MKWARPLLSSLAITDFSELKEMTVKSRVGRAGSQAWLSHPLLWTSHSSSLLDEPVSQSAKWGGYICLFRLRLL